MKLHQRTPLAWRNLTNEPKRLAASLAGIVFAVVLMFMQRGFQNALLDSTAEVLTRLNGDLILLSKSRYMLGVSERFPRRRLYQAEAVEGVASVDPLFVETLFAVFKNVENGAGRNIRVFGYDPLRNLVEIPQVVAQREKLLEPRTALMDVRSKKKYGPRRIGMETELAGKYLRLVGFFDLGTDFATDGNLIISEDSFMLYFPRPAADAGHDLTKVDVGVIRARQGVDVELLRNSIEAALPADVRVLTKQQFVDMERAFWAGATPIGFIFGMGTVMGFIVGVVVCYQILYGDVVEHLREFATLKAIGYSDRQLMRVVLNQAVLIAGVAYCIGLPVSLGLYKILGSITGLLFLPTVFDAAVILALSVGMCVASGCIAMRKLFSLDPAELF